MNRTITEADRRAEVNTFVRTTFGVRGTLRLHRSAFGADLLRAPVNVMLAPVLLIIRLVALLAKVLGFHRTAIWLSGRKVLLETNVSREVAALVLAFVADLKARGDGVTVPDNVLDHEVADYTGVRSAVGEITTTFLVLIAGFIVFQTATPGLVSLAGPVAEMRAHALAVEQFPLGQGLGKMYYGVFSTDIEAFQVVATGVVLAMLASVVTTFAGVIADPLQVMIGTHQRRLSRLLTRLEVDQGHSGRLAREHITARLADITDIALNLWRVLRG
ncbi:DUF6635 family protein [Sulfitobacter sp.]|uniref:DUF6635 family protein n=1 Tax=Sulfitobacter sp. TaxID=1903071 RepID=UPI003002765A